MSERSLLFPQPGRAGGVGPAISSDMAFRGPVAKVRNGPLCENPSGTIERRGAPTGRPRYSSRHRQEPFTITGHRAGPSSRARRKGDGTTTRGKRNVSTARIEYDCCRGGDRKVGRHAERGRRALRSRSQTNDQEINFIIRAGTYSRYGTGHWIGCSIDAAGHI